MGARAAAEEAVAPSIQRNRQGNHQVTDDALELGSWRGHRMARRRFDSSDVTAMQPPWNGGAGSTAARGCDLQVVRIGEVGVVVQELAHVDETVVPNRSVLEPAVDVRACRVDRAVTYGLDHRPLQQSEGVGVRVGDGLAHVDSLVDHERDDLQVAQQHDAHENRASEHADRQGEPERDVQVGSLVPLPERSDARVVCRLEVAVGREVVEGGRAPAVGRLVANERERAA